MINIIIQLTQLNQQRQTHYIKLIIKHFHYKNKNQNKQGDHMGLRSDTFT